MTPAKSLRSSVDQMRDAIARGEHESMLAGAIELRARVRRAKTASAAVEAITRLAVGVEDEAAQACLEAAATGRATWRGAYLTLD